MTEFEKLMKAFNAHSIKLAYVPSYLLEEVEKNQSKIVVGISASVSKGNIKEKKGRVAFGMSIKKGTEVLVLAK